MNSTTTDLIETYADYVTDNYCALAASVMYLYECILTLDIEVKYFWTRKMTGATVIFLLNRYLNIYFMIYSVVVLPNQSYPQEVCTSFAWIDLVSGVSLYIPAALFSGLRSFALSQNYAVSLLVFLLSMVPVGINYSVTHFQYQAINLPLVGCQDVANISEDLSNIFTIVSRTSLILANVLMIAITWYKLLRKNKIPQVKTFASVLLLDGTVYFLTLTILDILHLLFTLLSVFVVTETTGDTSHIVAFTEPLTAVLISRFMLDLQTARHAASDNLSTSLNQSQHSVIFGRIIGSIDASIIPQDSVYSDEDNGSTHEDIDEQGPVYMLQNVQTAEAIE